MFMYRSNPRRRKSRQKKGGKAYKNQTAVYFLERKTEIQKMSRILSWHRSKYFLKTVNGYCDYLPLLVRLKSTPDKEKAYIFLEKNNNKNGNIFLKRIKKFLSLNIVGSVKSGCHGTDKKEKRYSSETFGLQDFLWELKSRLNKHEPDTNLNQFD